MTAIRFKYNPLKATQAAALIIKLNGNSINYMSLLKLLYMCDRVAMQSLNQPISGDEYYSMDFGPVLSHVYDWIKGNGRPDQNTWQKYITSRDNNYTLNRNYNVQLLDEPGVSELNEEEENIIKGVYQLYGKMSQFYLADYTHQYFPEWHNPHGKAIPIPVEEVLRNVGKNEEDIAEIEMEVEEDRYLDLLLAE